MTWPTVPVGEIAQQVRGVSYDKSQVSNSAAPGLRPVLRAGNIQEGSLLLDKDLVYVPDSYIAHQQLLRPGDIVIAASSGSIDVVGKAAQLSEPWEGSFGAFCKVVRPSSDRVNPRYLHHFFQSTGYRRKISSLAAGANINNLKNEHIDDLLLPLPPLEEQRRIAEILDKAASITDAQARALELRGAMRESLFEDAFCLRGRSAVTIGADLPSSENGWEWKLLTDVARLATGHTPDRGNGHYWGGDIPWITLGDIRDLDGCHAYATKEMTTPEGITNSSAVLLPEGTVCFSRTASVGFSAIMGREMCTSQDFVNWVCGPDLLPEYLMHALISSRSRLRGLSTGSTHKTIYFSTVEQFKVLVPPLAIQELFCEKVRKLGSLLLADSAVGLRGLEESLSASIFATLSS
jgi:type I restriction enzyme S subunit